MKRGKKYQDAVKAFDKANLYDVADAISIVRKNATAKFDETIELHLRTGCDGRHAEQQIRGAVVLPHGTGKTVKVLVFAKGTKVDEAQAAGADFVGGEELIPKIQNEGWLDFDVVVATPDMMGRRDLLRCSTALSEQAVYICHMVDVTSSQRHSQWLQSFLY